MAGKSAAEQARNRSSFHRHRIAAASGRRARLLAIYGWITAEIARLPASEQDQAIRNLTDIPRALNERSTR